MFGLRGGVSGLSVRLSLFLSFHCSFTSFVFIASMAVVMSRRALISGCFPSANHLNLMQQLLQICAVVLNDTRCDTGGEDR